jgi:GPI-anchor transamidase subunit GAA1
MANVMIFLTTANTNGVQLLFSFAQFCSQFSFWSKDIIFLVTTGGYAGPLAWIEAYLAFEPRTNVLEFDKLKNHAGSIVTVLNLEFEGTWAYNAIAIHPVGINGRLPNADLVVTAVKSFEYSGMSAVLHEDGKHVQWGGSWQDKYPVLLKNLLSFIKAQAFGFPSLGHSLFAISNIEALSLTGIVGTENNIKLSQVGL